MKSITIKRENSASVYNSGFVFIGNEEIIQTEEEMEQACYQSLIDDVKKQDFHRTMQLLITEYLKWERKDVDNIQIVVDGSKGHCKMNINFKHRIEF